MAHTVPLPRVAPEDEYAHWYEQVLGWPVVGGPPAQLATGTLFDVLEVPADAGVRLLHRAVATGPVARMGRRMRFLVAAGSAEELDGLLDWLEWGGVALDLTALGAGGRITAPAPPGRGGHGGPGGRSGAAGAVRPGGTAVWLRPPGPGCEASLPGLSSRGPGAGPAAASGLVRLVGAAATECHRARLGRTAAHSAARTAPRAVSGRAQRFS
ncbi:SCO3374 family protein [Streptomyces antimicrobicus]|uniref:SCO3374 family protein n=1 Tax=Streptomyces antimicrobicus TaxID=2883108 RepID=A0ABS8B5X8_9ACTN|nr:SCO3374 family protein [Streptomyces antimicrobicus]MCB5180014.1 SCO3374 family protein [Streptomyces antimicrobicus]